MQNWTANNLSPNGLVQGLDYALLVAKALNASKDKNHVYNHGDLKLSDVLISFFLPLFSILVSAFLPTWLLLYYYLLLPLLLFKNIVSVFAKIKYNVVDVCKRAKLFLPLMCLLIQNFQFSFPGNCAKCKQILLLLLACWNIYFIAYFLF